MYPTSSVSMNTNATDIHRDVYGGSYIPPPSIPHSGIITIAGKYEGLPTGDDTEEDVENLETDTSSPYGKSSNGSNATSGNGSNGLSGLWQSFQTTSVELYSQASLLARAAAGESIGGSRNIEASSNWNTRSPNMTSKIGASETNFATGMSNTGNDSGNPARHSDSDVTYDIAGRWGNEADHREIPSQQVQGNELYHHDNGTGAIQHDEGNYLSV